MATFYHGTTQDAAYAIEQEGFLGSELSEDTNGFSTGLNLREGVVFLARDIDLALGYGDAIVEIEIDEELVSEFQECPATGMKEYFATVADMIKDAAWWIKED